tara:strand:+ start:1232 stop:1564 length:333 start_codon:yes stop_codon:yes gene_type:complete
MAQIKPGNYCPLIKKDCIGLKCSWYTQIRGANPQTGEPVDEWGCAITWLPMLTIENSQQQRSTSHAVESFRNEMVQANKTNIDVLSAAAQMLSQARDQKVIPADVKEVEE